MRHLFLTFTSALALAGTLQAATITGGSAVFTLRKDNPGVAGLHSFNAYFDDAASYSYITAWDSTNATTVNPGNLAYGTTMISGVEYVVLNDPVRPAGYTPAPVSGRTLQTTTLEFDTEHFSQAGFLADWSASTADAMGMFATVSGEKIGFTNMTRWNPFGSSGTLINGDFALVYIPGRAGGANSGLGLVSYAAGFNPFLFADLGNVSITFDNVSSELNIVGDVLLAGGVTYWDGMVTNGTNIGSFNLTAAVVPEPSTLGLLGCAIFLSGVLQRRRKI